MMRTTVLNVSCAEITNQQSKQATQRIADLSGIATFQTADGGKIMVIPSSPTSCVVITTINIVYNK